jgi:hypothetical protein
MDDKKKKIYIAVIIVCLLITGGILWYGFGGTGGTVEAPIANNAANTPLVGNSSGVPSGGASAAESSGNIKYLPQPNVPTAYPVPAVFPVTSSLDLSVFSSGRYQELVDYSPLTVTPEEIGRENPFINY